MKNLSLIFGLLCGSIFAQTTSMTFTGSSFMYVKDRYVYVKNGVDLRTANNNIFLRREGQLLQAGATTSQNKGLGNLSVFQEGTVNEFAYNIWCSPIGTTPALGTTVANTNFGISRLFRPTTNIASTVATNFGSGVGYSGSTSATTLNIANYWIFTFRSGINYADWIQIGNATTLLPGEGFTMKGTSGTDTANTVAIDEVTANNPGNAQRYDFRGKPNDGDIFVTVNSAKQTMTGNPYASAINLNYFLLENSGYNVNYLTGAVTTGGPVDVITGSAEYWEQQKTPAPISHNLDTYVAGFGIYTPNNTNANATGSYGGALWSTYNSDGTINVPGGSTGNYYDRIFAPVGQGFLITGKTGIPTSTATIKNVYRVVAKESLGQSIFERNSTSTNDNWPEIPNVANVDYTQFSRAAVPQIKIHSIMNNLVTRETTLAFNPNTTDGYDNAMDAMSSETDLPTDTYFSIGNTADKYMITTMPFEINKRVPFTLKANAQANFKITVGDIINFTDAENVYMFDATTNLYHDIKNDIFDITVPAGTHANRFEITFVNPSLSNPNFDSNDLIVFQNNNNQMLTVANPKLLDVTNVKLYDVAGKLVLNNENLSSKNSYEFSTAYLSDGVYVVKLNTKENNSIAQKVIVSNLK